MMGDPFISLGQFLGKKGGLPSWKFGPGGHVGGVGSNAGVFRKLRFNSRSQVEAATARSREALAQLFSETSVADACAVVATVGLAPATISRFNGVKDRLSLLDSPFSQSMSSRDCSIGNNANDFLLSMPLGGLPPSRAVEGSRRASIQVATLSRTPDKASQWHRMEIDDLVITDEDVKASALARWSLQPTTARDGLESSVSGMPARTFSDEVKVLLRPATSMGTAERVSQYSWDLEESCDAPAPATPPREQPTRYVESATTFSSPAGERTVCQEAGATHRSNAEVEAAVSTRGGPAQVRAEVPAVVGAVVSKSSSVRESSNIKLFDWARLELQQKLGSGSFSDVHLAVMKGSKGQPDMKVAVKMDTSGGASSLIKEAKMVCKLKHKNLIRIFGITTKPVALVCEVAPNGSLSAFLRKHGDGPMALGVAQTLRVLRDIAEGLQFLHSQQPPIVHRDLSGNNVLLDKHLRAKVSDFGLSKWQKHSCISNSSKSMGTASYMAPEVLSNGKITEKADVFSFGVLVWECLTGREPWQHLNPFQIIYQVCFTDQQLDVPEGCPPALAALMRQCWSKAPEDRPTWAAVLDALDRCLPQRPALMPVAQHA